MSKKTPYEHPEDKAMRTAGEAFAKTKRAAMLVAPGDLPALITTYGDGDAHDLLDKLREAYWASDAVQEAMREEAES